MPRTLSAVRGDRFVIAVQTRPHRKIFQVITKRDGSLFVAFPYAELGPGTIGIATVPAGTPSPSDLIVGHNFPATVHMVKYSHHPGGEAHFSLDGKIYTRVRRQAVPLHEVEGHLFTVMVQGLNCFKPLEQNARSRPDRAIIRAPLPTAPFEALKFVGRLYSRPAIPHQRIQELPDRGGLVVKNPDGSVAMGVLLLTTLQANGEQCFLLLTVEPIPRISTQSEEFITFMGGFDGAEVALDPRRDTQFLMFIYPYQGDVREVLERAGTVDRFT